MHVLVIGRGAEEQFEMARKFDSLPPSDLEVLDLTVNLSNERDYTQRLSACDLLVLGPSVATFAHQISTTVRSLAPKVDILMFVARGDYSSQAFRDAHFARVRKVLPDTASPGDILQELVRFQEELRTGGRLQEGKIVVVTQAKGGVGATTVAAALGDATASKGKSVVYWDFDVESRDLARSLKVAPDRGRAVTRWIEQRTTLTRDKMRDALVDVFEEACCLPLPDQMAAAMELVYSIDGASYAKQITQLLRLRSDLIIVDAAGKITPAVAAVLSIADHVLLVVDDSVLGMTAVPGVVQLLQPLVRRPEALHFVPSGTRMPTAKLIEQLELDQVLPPESYSLPPIPFDKHAANWPLHRRTLYTHGASATSRAIDEIVAQLNFRRAYTAEPKVVPIKQSRLGGLFGRKKEVEQQQPAEEAISAAKVV